MPHGFISIFPFLYCGHNGKILRGYTFYVCRILVRDLLLQVFLLLLLLHRIKGFSSSSQGFSLHCLHSSSSTSFFSKEGTLLL